MDEVIDFQQLKLNRVIQDSNLDKSITFQGQYKGKTAVIRLEKTPFAETPIRQALNDPKLTAQRNLINDVYSRYKLQPPAGETNDLKVIVVVPANETVVAKYSRGEVVLFSESSQTYHKLIEPFIANMLDCQKDYNQWVYNILDGQSETNHVILNDPDDQSGFMLLPSLKSSGDEKELHIIALCHRRDIRSIRDLTANHLPLLNNIHDKGTKTIRDVFSSNKGQLRSYIHYHPTFYYFHVHFEMVDASEQYKISDRDNLLITVINNITLVNDYYQRATLTYPLAKATALYKELVAKGALVEPLDK